MNSKSVGFVGGGRVTRILLGGLAAKSRLPGEIVVSDPDEAALARLKGLFPSIRTVVKGNRQAAAQDLVFAAVHPPAMKEALSEIGPALKPGAILVSLAPKSTVEAISRILGGFRRIARMIPNAPSIVGCGFNPICFSGDISRDERAGLVEWLSACGAAPEVAEPKLEAYAILSGMGPTYFWPQLFELRELSHDFGLEDGEAMRALSAMLEGAVETMRTSGLGRADVEDLIPVKPLGEEMGALCGAYGAKLRGLMEKIRP